MALRDGRRREGSGSSGGGFGAPPRPGSRADRRGRREADEAESEADWDEELLADLSDSGIYWACRRGYHGCVLWG